MKSLSQPAKPTARAFSLLEMVLSLAILSVVMVSAGSAMLFASAAMPNKDSAVSVSLRDHTLLSRIDEDLSLALYIIDQSDTAVTVLVPDRTGNGLPDRVRYAWAGTAGDPITFTLNDSDPVVVHAGVDRFGLIYDKVQTTDILPGPFIEGSELLLSAATTTFASPTWSLDSSTMLAQRFRPSISSDAVGFRVSRLFLYGRVPDGAADLPVAIRDMSGDTPTGPIYASQVPRDSEASAEAGEMPGSKSWYEIRFPNSKILPASGAKAMVIGAEDGQGNIGSFESELLSLPAMVYSGNSGSTWHRSSWGSLIHVLYGREVYQDPAIEFVTERVVAIRVSFRSKHEDAGVVTRSVRLRQSPQVLEYFCDADFTGDPSGLDLNADGLNDWLYQAGSIPSANLSKGVWSVSGSLETQPAGAFTAPVTVDTRIRSSSGQGLGIYGPFTGSGSDLLPLSLQIRQDGKGGQDLVIYNSADLSKPAAAVNDLPQGFIDVRLILLPAENVVCVSVNGMMAGSIKLDRTSDSATPRTLSIRPIDSDGQIDYIRVRVGGDYEEQSTSSGGLIDFTLNLLGL